jgi:ElaB/YqjD/DUF883 family membrane-anchored ribosome-binding protein
MSDTDVRGEEESGATSETELRREGEGEPAADVEQARRDVEHTRAELGDTVEALSQKADLKAQVSRKAEERPLPAIGVALGAGLLLGWLIARR